MTVKGMHIPTPATTTVEAKKVGKGRSRPLTQTTPRDGAVLPVRDLARSWVRGLINPVAVMRALPDVGWPKAGMVAVVTRFAVQDLVQTLPLVLLGRRPFIPAKLPIRPEHHCRAQLVFLPAFGVGQWLLMGAATHGLLRLSGERSDLSRVLDVIGTRMLTPMPPLWLCDMALIAADRFRLPELAITKPTVQLWETALFGIGLRTALGVPWQRAMSAGLTASVVYVLGASRFVR